MKRAVIAGSFNPFTLGHKELYDRAKQLFDEVIIAVAEVTDKATLSTQKRMEIIRATIKDAQIKCFDGLLTDFLKAEKADVLVRGIRNTVDFEYEKNLDSVYKTFCDVEIVYLIPSVEKFSFSSTIVRSLLKAGGDISRFVDTKAEKLIRNYYAGGYGIENKPIN